MAVVAGCFNPRPATGIACSSTGDCPDDLVCISGTCERSGETADAAIADTSAIDAAALPALVQQVTSSLEHSAMLTATLPATPVAGDVLVMIGANEHDSLATVAGGAAMWTKVAGSAENANVELWVAVADGSSAAVTIDCTTTCDAQPIWMNVSEWRGLASSTGASISTAGATSPVAPGGITTHGAHDLVVFAVADLQPNVFGDPMPGSWQALMPIEATAIAQGAWYAVGPGHHAPSVTETGNHWDAVLVALPGL